MLGGAPGYLGPGFGEHFVHPGLGHLPAGLDELQVGLRGHELVVEEVDDLLAGGQLVSGHRARRRVHEESDVPHSCAVGIALHDYRAGPGVDPGLPQTEVGVPRDDEVYPLHERG